MLTIIGAATAFKINPPTRLSLAATGIVNFVRNLRRRNFGPKVFFLMLSSSSRKNLQSATGNEDN